MASDNTVVVKEVRERNEAELTSLLASKVEELHQHSFKHALGQLRETHMLGELKKDIARLRTVLSERQKSKQAEG